MDVHVLSLLGDERIPNGCQVVVLRLRLVVAAVVCTERLDERAANAQRCGSGCCVWTSTF